MKVMALPEVRQYLKEVSQILYEKEYFGFLESSEKYIEELFESIKDTLPHRQKKKAPAYFNKYGRDMYYCSFRKNKQTQWYVFFQIYEDKGEVIYLVRYISNNHMISKYL